MTTVTHVRNATLALLQEHLPGELQRQRDALDSAVMDEWLREPRTWKRLPTYTNLAIDQSPAVVVASTGLATTPKRRGDGEIDATWRVNIFAAVRGPGYEETTDLLGVYLGCLRSIMLRHRIDLYGSKRALLMGESFDSIDHDASRSIQGGAVAFNVPVLHIEHDEGPTREKDPYGVEATSRLVTVQRLEE